MSARNSASRRPQVHFIHAIPSGPNVDFYDNGKILQPNLAYKAVTNFANIDTGQHSFSYAAVNTTTQLATDTSIQRREGAEYTVIALPDAGFLPSIAVIDDPFDKGLLSSSARVRGFNASANAPNLDLYLVAPGTNIAPSARRWRASLQERRARDDAGFDLRVGRHVQLIATLPGIEDAGLHVGLVHARQQRGLARHDAAFGQCGLATGAGEDPLCWSRRAATRSSRRIELPDTQ